MRLSLCCLFEFQVGEELGSLPLDMKNDGCLYVLLSSVLLADAVNGALYTLPYGKGVCARGGSHQWSNDGEKRVSNCNAACCKKRCDEMFECIAYQVNGFTSGGTYCAVFQDDGAPPNGADGGDTHRCCKYIFPWVCDSEFRSRDRYIRDPLVFMNHCPDILFRYSGLMVFIYRL